MSRRSISRNRTRDRFRGRIAGVGSTSGVRVVVGRWDDGPWGSFVDLMVEDASGHRVLVAPTQLVADFVAATYTFDEVSIEPVVAVDDERGWQVTSSSLTIRLGVGGPTLLGRVLGLVPDRLATSPVWCAAVDPVARVVLRGVRTRGSAGGGRREWYGATTVRAVTSLDGSWRGAPLGALAAVDPPCRFGFSSTPRRPSVVSVVTTVERGADQPPTRVRTS